MRTFALVITAAVLGACSPPVDPNVKAAIDAGTAAIRGTEECFAHFKSAGNMDIPQCNGSKAMAAYRDAKMKITVPVPALQAIDEKLQAQMLEGMSLVGLGSKVAR